VLTPEALAFVARLQREFGGRRLELLVKRDERQARLDAGEVPQFLAETKAVRELEWQVAKAPKDLQDRRVEITGPTDRKMLINALNSGARVFMADFEDSNSPTWANLVGGQVNLIDAIERRIDFTSPEGKEYRLNDKVATSICPRWKVTSKHGCGTTSSTSRRTILESRAAPFAPRCSSRRSSPRSRWRRSCTSCAITRAV
jgi:malate synthase